MSLHYLLDGYNITKRTLPKTVKNLQSERESLVHFIEVHRPQGSVHNSVTIVFDGQPGIVQHSSSSFVKVVFSQNESADEVIKRLTQKASHKKSLVVVTNDRELKYAVKLRGASVISVDEFMAQGKTEGHHPSAVSRVNAKTEEKYISKVVEHDITSEFKKIWLKKNDE